ncbi:TPA: DUF4065 domain-containing protein [Clostridioides difficile]|uniref:Panacea domain-containing protein n=1 Tax=Clostridioides difficile TaxID=1496 RepID=UPI00097FF2CF|nr:type II toxin-antitoxin system antitoxin SocA domain-containing protein [Clostridioides difficile]AXU28781.1 putative zinc finger/helix-turn-helix protein, YgiT family [Clostridioides difficile]AXU32569.1 putative zinc finger/helix-turn-helix protein, YgiT family [Clostridioides difficile]AXU36357.1 putative zinc finger/helix-turn-helix protein, YgiT family [Clostridioides difficile]MCP8413166.1 DUF4065 domain-containing protein [Clostridioides difficile]MDC9392145.1 DUF4065 domain-containi
MFDAKYNAMDIAKYVLWYCEKKNNFAISNLKLQKILYYIQGRYVARYGEPLFDDIIEAWDYGPVVPEVYFSYNDYGNRAILGEELDDINVIDESDREFINEITKPMIKKDVWKIVKQTHSEDPWKYSYAIGRNEEISIWDMEEWFKEH